MASTVENEVAGVTSALQETTLESLSSRHRKERKELQAKIQELKKNAPKSDKKKRKEAMEEVTRLEGELEKRHAAELKVAQEQETVNHNHTPSPCQSQVQQQNAIEAEEVCANEVEDVVQENSGSGQTRVSKAQKRRDKKAREAKQRDEEIRVAAEEAQYAPKALEAQAIKAKLKERQLALHQVNSDGDCLYNAIRHQLVQNGLAAYSVRELRNETANYIHANKDALIHYMPHPQTGELLSDTQFEEYCEVVRNTPAWGGQVELKALSSVLKVPIEVLQAEGPPTVQGADEFAGPNLMITYHRLLYSLGEHYNSTKPLAANNEDDGDNENALGENDTVQESVN